MLAFLHDAKAPVLDGHFQPARGEGAHEDDLLRVLADVDEAAAAGDALAEAARVDVALRVAFAEAEERGVEPAAVDEIELGAMVDHRLVVHRGAEIEAAHRHPAHDAGIHVERDEVLDALLVGDLRHLVGHAADADVDDGARLQLERRAPRDHLALAQLHGAHLGKRDAQLAREGGVVLRAVGLHVVGALGEHHAVDEHAGDLHVARVERAFVGDALDLREDDAAGVARGDRERQVLEGERLALGGDVAVRIGRGAADQRHVDGERLEEEKFLAADLQDRDDLFRRDGIHAPAVLARVDESAQSHARERAGLARADVAVEIGDDAFGQVVGLDAILDRHRLESRREPEVAADHAAHQAFVREVVQAALLHDPLAAGEDQREGARRPAGEEALLERDEELVRRAVAAVAGGSDGIAIVDDRDRVLGLDEFLQSHGWFPLRRRRSPARPLSPREGTLTIRRNPTSA